MSKYRFYRSNTGWFIDVLYFPLNKSWLEMVAGADDLLDRISEGEDEVILEVSSAPIPYSDGVLVKKEKNIEGLFRGRIYEAKAGYTENKNLVIENIWLCAVTLWVFWKYPKKIYYKKLK